jgi:hypothetical protein
MRSSTSTRSSSRIITSALNAKMTLSLWKLKLEL